MRISDWSSDVCSSDLAGEASKKRGPCQTALTFIWGCLRWRYLRMPPLQERASGGVLLLDPLRPGVDRDRPRLQGLRHLAGPVDVKHAVLQRSAGHPDVVGKLEPPLERPAGNAALEIGRAFVPPRSEERREGKGGVSTVRY